MKKIGSSSKRLFRANRKLNSFVKKSGSQPSVSNWDFSPFGSPPSSSSSNRRTGPMFSDVSKNPTTSTFDRIVKESSSWGAIRILRANGIWYVWTGHGHIHTDVLKRLGITSNPESFGDDAMPHVYSANHDPADKMIIGITLEISQDENGRTILFPNSDVIFTNSMNKIVKELRRDKKFMEMTKNWIVDNVHGAPKHKGSKDPGWLRRRIERDIKYNLAEDMSRKELHGHLQSFVKYTCDQLNIAQPPSIRYKEPDAQGEQPSFASYSPSTKEVSVMTKNRHPMDIFRSVAHELVHHKQNEDGRIGKDVKKEGSTGSDIENEANSHAGVIMRNFGKANPEMFGKTYVTEKSELDHVVMVNSPEWASLRRKERRNLLKVGSKKTHTLADYENISMRNSRSKHDPLSEGIHDRGTFKAVFLAGGAGSGKDFILHKCIEGNGLTELNSDKAFEYILRKEGEPLILDKSTKRDLLRGRAKAVTHARKQHQLAGRMGVIINGTADEYAKIARLKHEYETLGYETMMVFVSTSNKVSRLRNVERGKLGGRTVPENIRFAKWRGASVNKDKFRELFGSHFVEVDNSPDLRNADSETKAKYDRLHLQVFRKVREFVNRPVRNGRAQAWVAHHRALRGIDEKFEDLLNEIGGAGNWGTPQLTDKYKKDTPGEEPGVTHEMGYHETKKEKVKIFGKLPGLNGDRIGPTAGSAKNPSFVGNQTGDINPYILPEPFSRWSPIDRWSVNEETRRRFKERYGQLAEKKIQETAEKLRKESLTDPFDGSMGCTPNASNIQDNGKVETAAEFEKTSLFSKKNKKAKYKKNFRNPEGKK